MKVYCTNCTHYRRCDSGIVCWQFEDRWKQNQNNDCHRYKCKWWKFWVKKEKSIKVGGANCCCRKRKGE